MVLPCRGCGDSTLDPTLYSVAAFHSAKNVKQTWISWTTLPSYTKSTNLHPTNRQRSPKPIVCTVQIAVVSITGPRRSDNSDFLNRIAQKIYKGASPTEGGSEENNGNEWKPPFDKLDGEAADILVHILPRCTNPLADNPGTTLLMIDTPEMWTHQR